MHFSIKSGSPTSEGLVDQISEHLSQQWHSPISRLPFQQTPAQELCKLSKASQMNPDMESQGIKQTIGLWVLGLLHNLKVYQKFYFKANQMIFL